MSRIRFAAARGARLEREVELLSGKTLWQETELQWGLDDELRIHPEDTHLQYGLFSNALREEALSEHVMASVFAGKFGNFWLRASDHMVFQEMNQLERSFALLILAEALADTGA